MRKPRMTKKLKFWIDHAVANHSSASCKRIRLIRDVLAEFEAAGEAMRYRSANGKVAWKPTRRLLQRLAEDEREALADLEEAV
jgi:hypothetical protein